MAFDLELLDLMAETITIEPVASRDDFNKPTYGAAVSYRCHISESSEQVVTVDGRQFVNATVIWAAPHAVSGFPSVSPDCRVTLPDGSQPPIRSFAIVHDEEGANHMKITLDRPGRDS